MSKTSNLAEAIRQYDDLRDAMSSQSGCMDGGCLVKRPKGMHTNGGCKCHRDQIVSQRMMYAGERLEIDPSHPIDGIEARDETIRQLEAQMRALLGKMDGYALVPKEPSDAMRRAAQKAHQHHCPHAEWLKYEWSDFRRVWAAMLAAAKIGGAA